MARAAELREKYHTDDSQGILANCSADTSVRTLITLLFLTAMITLACLGHYKGNTKLWLAGSVVTIASGSLILGHLMATKDKERSLLFKVALIATSAALTLLVLGFTRNNPYFFLASTLLLLPLALALPYKKTTPPT